MQSVSVRNSSSPVDLDTAISFTGLGKFHWGLVIIAGGCLATMTADSLGIAFALAAIECDLNLSIADKGLLSGSTFLGMIFTTYSWGFASDTFGRRGVLLLSLGIGWLLSVCASLAPIFWLMVLFRVLTGATYAGMSTTFYAYLTEFLPPKQRARYLAWTFLFEGVMFGLMPAAAWLTLPLTWSLDLGFVVLRTWRIFALINGLIPLLPLAIVLRYPETPKYLLSVGKHEEAVNVLAMMFNVNTGRPTCEYPVHAVKKTTEDERHVQISVTLKRSLLAMMKAMWYQVLPIFGRKHLFTTGLACILKFCVYSGAYGLFLWIPDILNHMMSYRSANPNVTVTICDATNVRSQADTDGTCTAEIDSLVYWSSLILCVTYCIGYTLVGVLVNGVGERLMLGVLQFSSGFVGLGIYWATNTTLVTILFVIYILQDTLSLAPLSAIIVDLYPTHLRSTAMGFALTAGRIGASLTGCIVGSLFDYDCTSTIFGLSAISFASGILSILIPRNAEQTIKSLP